MFNGVFRCAITVIALGIGLARPATADMAQHLGPIADVVELGQDQTWTTADQSGWFMMTNTSNPTAIRYYWGDIDDIVDTPFRVSVNTAVRAETADLAYGGIMLNVRSEQQYMAVLLGSDGLVHIAFRTPDGFNLQPYEEARAKGDGSDVLGVIIDGDTAVFDLNGSHLFDIESDQPLSTKTGVIAIGAGRFGFTGFEATQMERSSQNTDPAADPPILPASLTPSEVEVLLGATFGIYFHEMAHAVIGETDLPAPGPEEDVADSFSAYILAEILSAAEPQTRDIARRIVEASALMWFYSAKDLEAQNVTLDWQDEHSPDMQRFRHWLCIVYGSDPEAFDEVAQFVGLTERTRYRCKIDYAEKWDAWEELLALRGRNLAPDVEGAMPADTPGGKVNIRFETGRTDRAQAIEQLIRKEGTIEAVTAYMSAYFVWPNDVSVTFRACGEANAWYDPRSSAVTMCYEAIEYYATRVLLARGT